jgi:polyhydroxybutyrate depolymerase
MPIIKKFVCVPVLVFAILLVALAPQRGNSQVSPSSATKRQIEVDGRERHYMWYLPPHAKGQALPVILAFHGGGRESAPGAETFDRYIDLTAVATKAGFVVVYPDGYKHSWNAGPGPDGKSPNWGPAAAEKIDDVKFVVMLLQDLAASVPIDRHRIFATGMSNGSAMTYRLGVELSDQIAAVAGVASELSLTGPLSIKRPMPIMYFWGTADQMERVGAPSSSVRAHQNIETWKQLDGCTGPPDVAIKGAGKRETFHGKAPVVVWTISGMGHSWPGVNNGRIEKMLLGPANLDVNASTEMVEFFKEHPLP